MPSIEIVLDDGRRSGPLRLLGMEQAMPAILQCYKLALQIAEGMPAPKAVRGRGGAGSRAFDPGPPRRERSPWQRPSSSDRQNPQSWSR